FDGTSPTLSFTVPAPELRSVTFDPVSDAYHVRFAIGGHELTLDVPLTEIEDAGPSRRNRPVSAPPPPRPINPLRCWHIETTTRDTDLRTHYQVEVGRTMGFPSDQRILYVRE